MTKRRVVGILALSMVVSLLVGWRAIDSGSTARAADPAPPEQVPVTAAAVKTQDIPVFLEGLGTVQALNVVEIKAQVNGTLIALPAREGQEVQKGDIVAEIDPRPYKAVLDQAMAQRDEDAATLRSARLDLQRYQDLAKRSFAPVQQVDDQQAAVDKGAAAVQVDNAAIETAQINLGYCVIRAPISGRVSLYQLDVGNLVEVASQTGIVSITQDKPISVVFTLPEADLPQVRTAQARGPVPVEVTRGQSDQPIATGTLLTPNNTIDTATGTISLKANFANADDSLWPGAFVNTRVQVDTLHNVVTVPLPAIQHGPGGLFVYVVNPDQTVAQVNVQVGYQTNSQAVVTKGLSATGSVVVSGQSRLAPGTHVKVGDASQAARPPAGSADGASPV